MVFLPLILAGQVVSEPANVMVEGLTFVRPAGWKWRAPTGNTNIVAVFDILDDKGEKLLDVLFYTTDKPIEEVKDTWKATFTTSGDKYTFQEEEMQTETRRIVYVTLQGTFEQKDKKDKPKKPDYSLVGAIIRKEQQTLVIRTIGPASRTSKVATDLRKMIEDAVKAE